MRNMTSHISINGSTSARFAPHEHHPFDAMRIILEQAIFNEYVSATSVNATICKDMRDNIAVWLGELPTNLPYSESHLSSLYNSGIKWIKNCISNLSHDVSIMQDLYAIFNTPVVMKKVVNNITTCYKGSMTEDFLTMYIAFIGLYYDKDKYPEGKMYECALYVPSIGGFSSVDIKSDNSAAVVILEPKAMRYFDLDKASSNIGGLLGLISCFSTSFTIDDLIPVLASFCLEYGNYVMTGHPLKQQDAISMACFDLVTRSEYVTAMQDSSSSVAIQQALNEFCLIVKDMVNEERIAPLEEYELFGELLSILGESSQIVNFFVRPVALIKATEALAFRSSDYASFISDRIVIGMEAVEGENEDPSSEDDEISSTSEELPESDDDATIEGGEGDSLESAEDNPTIDPTHMLLELADDDESLADYMYRDLVARRIKALLQNPPENVLPDDLLMLKRWRSRWLYLVSRSCLRDYLTRLTIRLSE